MRARNIIQQAYSCFHTLQRQLNHILSPLGGVKAYAQMGVSRRVSKHRSFESCHSSRQTSENQGQRLLPPILRALARGHLNPGYDKLRNSVTRTKSESQPSTANEKSAKEGQRGKGSVHLWPREEGPVVGRSPRWYKGELWQASMPP